MSRFASSFSPDYRTARTRFRKSAESLGCRHAGVEIGAEGPNGEALTIDFARFGPKDADQLLVVSCGTHGVEGFFGSAVELAMLEQRLPERRLPEGVALLFVHAVNPYGFSHIRRVNEDNIDLNRNFMLDGDAFEGADPGYTAFDSMLNPTSPPGGVDPFVLRAALNIARHGMPAMKNALVQGQYEYPKGLFYGGKGPSASQRILKSELPEWVGSAQRVVHLDLHTGMGKWETYVLAVSRSIDDPSTRWLKKHFGDDKVEALDPNGVLYEIRGVLGTWLQSLFGDISYHCMLAEFGTYNPLRMISALRAENRAAHWGSPGDAQFSRAKHGLKEAFAPASASWRDHTVATALELVEQGLVALASAG
ncbi:MAG: DUF2817 domain-containing protein [Polyangiaceae bacterium]